MNIVIRGFNTSWKIMTFGFHQLPYVGFKVKMCRTWTDPYINMKVSTE